MGKGIPNMEWFSERPVRVDLSRKISLKLHHAYNKFRLEMGCIDKIVPIKLGCTWERVILELC